MSRDLYPKEVEIFIEALHKSFMMENFYVDHEIEDHGEAALYEVAGPMLMKKWVNGELTLDLPDEFFGQIAKETAVFGMFLKLREKGMIDWIEDENGTDIAFLTKKGKEHLNDEDIEERSI